MTGSLLTASDVAELLGVPKSWVYEQSRAGRIPVIACMVPRGTIAHARRMTEASSVTSRRVPRRGQIIGLLAVVLGFALSRESAQTITR